MEVKQNTKVILKKPVETTLDRLEAGTFFYVVGTLDDLLFLTDRGHSSDLEEFDEIFCVSITKGEELIMEGNTPVIPVGLVGEIKVTPSDWVNMENPVRCT
ncbi:hypothetical protein [Vibrio phage RYC]|nr:hypothetical protein [Vibrio phage RYC]